MWLLADNLDGVIRRVVLNIRISRGKNLESSGGTGRALIKDVRRGAGRCKNFGKKTTRTRRGIAAPIVAHGRQ